MIAHAQDARLACQNPPESGLQWSSRCASCSSARPHQQPPDLVAHQRPFPTKPIIKNDMQLQGCITCKPSAPLAADSEQSRSQRLLAAETTVLGETVV